ARGRRRGRGSRADQGADRARHRVTDAGRGRRGGGGRDRLRPEGPSLELLSGWGFVVGVRSWAMRQGRRERSYRIRYGRDRGRGITPVSVRRRLSASFRKG